MIQIKTIGLEDIAQWHFNGFLKSANHFDKILQSKIEEADSEEKPLLEYIQDNIELILKGKPNELEQFVVVFQAKYEKQLSAETIKAKLIEIFDYSKFCNNQNKIGDGYWNGYRLMEKLNVPTCPYCNRQYTHTVIDKNEEKNKSENETHITRPDFDHFLDKGTYPYLAISFYNLVPSCQICNSRMKGSKQFHSKTHVHPFMEGFNDLIKFQIKITDIKFFEGKQEHCEIEFKEKKVSTPDEQALIKKGAKNIEDFRLKDLYQEHKDYVHELMNKAIIYNDDYLLSLSKQLGTNFKDKKDLALFISSNHINDDELHLRPLSKLTKDMFEQFDL